MTREEKLKAIESIETVINDGKILYLSDISGIDAEKSSKLRRLCHKNGIKLHVVKNTLLKKAMEKSAKNFDEFYPTLKGNTSLMIAEVGNVPARLIKEFRKESERPIFKGAMIEESFYIGENQLELLVNLKSKEELIGEIITILQSPLKNVISSLQSGKHTIAGLVKTLGEREN